MAKTKTETESRSKPQAFIIHPNGEMEEVAPKGPKKSFTLQELREIVSGKTGPEAESCTVQFVWGSGKDMPISTLGRVAFVCDEEGKLKLLEFNVIATQYAVASRAIYPSDYMAGRVLIARASLIR